MLREQAAIEQKPATVLAREAIEDWLRQRRKTAVREAIGEYAAKHAGTDADLDRELEAAALEVWGKSKRPPKKSR